MIEYSTHFQLIAGAFPHVGAQLKSAWGKADFIQVIDNLQQDKREMHRAGFSADIFFALQKLESEHDAEFPQYARKSGIWGFTV